MKKIILATKKRISAFTLIELLVVIAIIALLLSIITPSLRKAKQMAQSVSCRSNLRQMGIGFNTYAMENDNKPVISEGGEDFWFLQIAPYLGDATFQKGIGADPETELRSTMQVLKCALTKSPVEETGYSPGTARNQYRYHVTNVEGSYAINRWVGGWIASTFDPETPEGRENLRKSYRDSACQKSNVPAVSDSIWVGTTPQGADLPPDQWPAGSDLTTGNTSCGGLGRLTTNRHGMKTNLLYCDGHVDVIDLEALWTQRWHKEFKVQYDITIDRQ